jgi:hypothetical protein
MSVGTTTGGGDVKGWSCPDGFVVQKRTAGPDGHIVIHCIGLGPEWARPGTPAKPEPRTSRVSYTINWKVKSWHSLLDVIVVRRVKLREPSSAICRKLGAPYCRPVGSM